jgi:hypothetical protein
VNLTPKESWHSPTSANRINATSLTDPGEGLQCGRAHQLVACIEAAKQRIDSLKAAKLAETLRGPNPSEPISAPEQTEKELDVARLRSPRCRERRILIPGITRVRHYQTSLLLGIG